MYQQQFLTPQTIKSNKKLLNASSPRSLNPSQPIPFTNPTNGHINMNLLKDQLDRRVEKITNMIKGIGNRDENYHLQRMEQPKNNKRFKRKIGQGEGQQKLSWSRYLQQQRQKQNFQSEFVHGRNSPSKNPSQYNNKYCQTDLNLKAFDELRLENSYQNNQSKNPPLIISSFNSQSAQTQQPHQPTISTSTALNDISHKIHNNQHPSTADTDDKCLKSSFLICSQNEHNSQSANQNQNKLKISQLLPLVQQENSTIVINSFQQQQQHPSQMPSQTPHQRRSFQQNSKRPTCHIPLRQNNCHLNSNTKRIPTKNNTQTGDPVIPDKTTTRRKKISCLDELSKDVYKSIESTPHDIQMVLRNNQSSQNSSSEFNFNVNYPETLDIDKAITKRKNRKNSIGELSSIGRSRTEQQQQQRDLTGCQAKKSTIGVNNSNPSMNNYHHHPAKNLNSQNVTLKESKIFVEPQIRNHIISQFEERLLKNKVPKEPRNNNIRIALLKRLEDRFNKNIIK